MLVLMWNGALRLVLVLLLIGCLVLWVPLAPIVVHRICGHVLPSLRGGVVVLMHLLLLWR